MDNTSDLPLDIQQKLQELELELAEGLTDFSKTIVRQTAFSFQATLLKKVSRKNDWNFWHLIKKQQVRYFKEKTMERISAF